MLVVRVEKLLQVEEKKRSMTYRDCHSDRNQKYWEIKILELETNIQI